MRCAFIFFVFLAPLTASTASTPETCSSRHVASCDSLRSTPMNAAGALGFPPSKDGTVYYNPMGAYAIGGALSDEGQVRLESMSHPSDAQVTRALRTAEDVRTAMIEFVRGNVADATLSPADRTERDQIVARLQSVKIRMTENEDTLCDGNVTLGTPSLGYWPQIHSILICPAAATGDVASIVRSLAHEMGHLAGECQITRSVFELQPERGSYSDIRDCDRSLIEGEEQGYVRDRALRLLEEGRVTHVVESSQDPAIRSLVTCGILKEVPNSAITRPSLTRATQSCVERNGATQFSRAFESYLESDVSHGIPRARARSELERTFQPACFGRNQEQFADSFAGGFLGFYATKNRWSATDARASMLLFTGMQCLNIADYNTFEYPTYDVRATTFMSSPRMASLLRCSADRGATSICALTLTTRRDSAPDASRTRATTTRPARANR